MKNNKVYIHITPNNKVYIGITSGSVERRWRNNGDGYKNQYFYRAIKKYGWNNIEHKVLYTNLTKEEAEQKEIELILKYKSNDKKYGYNVDEGGYLFSETHLKNLSKSHKGYKHTKEAKEKMSKRMLGNKYAVGGNGRKGYKLSEEEKEHLRNTKKCKEVICIELNKTYKSTHQAAKETNTDRRNIQRCCNGKLHTANGYHWKYKDIA